MKLKQFSPFLIEKGLRFAESHFVKQGYITIHRSERTLVFGGKGQTVAVYVTPRDYTKEMQSAMIHIDDEYAIIENFFRSNGALQGYVLIAHGYRVGLTYQDGYFILVPNSTISRVYSKPQNTINIGTSSSQRLKWEAEGVTYHPIVGKVWDLTQSQVHNEPEQYGHINWAIRFGKREAVILKEVGLQEYQWFSLENDCLEEREHYIGVGKFGTRAYTLYGIWYQVKRGKSRHKIVPIAQNKSGLRYPVQWPDISINATNRDESLLLLVRSIEAGWLVSTKDFKPADYTIPIVPSDPLDWDYDGQTMASYRKDQASLREHLLGGRQEAECGICGVTYPADMLWAAHIKKRSACTAVEKGDHANIARLMCKMGCDDLFEKGYIGVKEGIVIPLRPTSSTTLRSYIDNLVGANCNSWNQSTAKYCDWHVQYFMSGSHMEGIHT